MMHGHRLRLTPSDIAQTAYDTEIEYRRALYV